MSEQKEIPAQEIQQSERVNPLTAGRETFLDRLKRERAACQRKIEAYDNLIDLVDGKEDIIQAIDNLNNV